MGQRARQATGRGLLAQHRRSTTRTSPSFLATTCSTNPSRTGPSWRIQQSAPGTALPHDITDCDPRSGQEPRRHPRRRAVGHQLLGAGAAHRLATPIYTFHKYWTAPDQGCHPELPGLPRASYQRPHLAWAESARILMPGFMILWRYWKKTRSAGRSALQEDGLRVILRNLAEACLLGRDHCLWQDTGNTGDTEKRIAARPPLEHARAAFQGLKMSVSLIVSRTQATFGL